MKNLLGTTILETTVNFHNCFTWVLLSHYAEEETEAQTD